MAQVSLGFDDRTGKRIRKTVYGDSQAEVREKLHQLKSKPASQLLSKSVDTVTEFLNNWIADEITPSKSGKTIQEYDDTAKNYVMPYLGKLKLAKLTPVRIQQWMGDMSRDGFTPNMRARALRVFRNALNYAVRLHLIPHNPSLAITLPKVVRRDIQPLEAEQCRKLFGECESDRLGDMIVLAAMTGLRKGELLALEWSDVNLAERVLTVRRTLEEVAGRLKTKEPKSKSGRRAVVLEDIGAEALQNRLRKAKEEGFTPELVPIVFPNTLGRHQRGSNFDRRIWHPIRDRAGIPESVHFHDLRHTAASHLLAVGVHPKVVQERMGHSDISLTMNTYSHLLSGLQSDAVERLSGLDLKPRKKLVAVNGGSKTDLSDSENTRNTEKH